MRDQIEMYLDFRKELDKHWVPAVLKALTVREIIHEGQKAGMLAVYEDGNGYYYINCLYIKPEYRRRGIAKKAVLEWYNERERKNVTLRIIHNNKPAQRFWRRVFDLLELQRDETDALYKVVGVKETD